MPDRVLAGAAPTGFANGTATTTVGSANLTAVTPTTGWKNGMAITGPGIPAGTTILSGAGTATMVMSKNATAAATVAVSGADAGMAAFPPGTIWAMTTALGTDAT